MYEIGHPPNLRSLCSWESHCLYLLITLTLMNQHFDCNFQWPWQPLERWVSASAYSNRVVVKYRKQREGKRVSLPPSAKPFSAQYLLFKEQRMSIYLPCFFEVIPIFLPNPFTSHFFLLLLVLDPEYPGWWQQQLPCNFLCHTVEFGSYQVPINSCWTSCAAVSLLLS